jgi:Meckel syndrome type 1 protein
VQVAAQLEAVAVVVVKAARQAEALHQVAQLAEPAVVQVARAVLAAVAVVREAVLPAQALAAAKVRPGKAAVLVLLLVEDAEARAVVVAALKKVERRKPEPKAELVKVEARGARKARAKVRLKVVVPEAALRAALKKAEARAEAAALEAVAAARRVQPRRAQAVAERQREALKLPAKAAPKAAPKAALKAEAVLKLVPQRAAHLKAVRLKVGAASPVLPEEGLKAARKVAAVGAARAAASSKLPRQSSAPRPQPWAVSLVA